MTNLLETLYFIPLNYVCLCHYTAHSYHHSIVFGSINLQLHFTPILKKRFVYSNEAGRMTRARSSLEDIIDLVELILIYLFIKLYNYCIKNVKKYLESDVTFLLGLVE